MSRLRPAIFLDRDGVIIENRPAYVRTLAEVVFIPGAVEALAHMRRARPAWPVLIVSNQAGIGRGLVAPEAVAAINQRIVQRVAAAGGQIDGIYVCPHRPDEGCVCRKPAPGLLRQAAAEWELDLAASVMVGDSATDVQAARAAGATPILVQTGLSERWAAELAHAQPWAPVICRDLPAAVAHILAAFPDHANAP